MLRELKVVEQRYRAVLEVLDGIPVTEVAERFGVVRQTVHRWVARYRDGGIDGLADRSHAPKAHPWRISAEVEAVICDLRGSHRRWGPRRLVFELAKRGHPGVSRSTVYRVLSVISCSSRCRGAGAGSSTAGGSGPRRWNCGSSM
jgi:transposase